MSCLNNMKQIGLGTLMYVGDNQDTFPGSASNGAGHQDDDWIYWQQTGLPPGKSIQDSVVIVAMGGRANTNVFKCPLDRRTGTASYPYSYTMVSGVEGGVNHGITSYGSGPELKFKQARVKRPTEKLMLAEEQTSGTGTGTESSHQGDSVDDGRFALTSNYLSPR